MCLGLTIRHSFSEAAGSSALRGRGQCCVLGVGGAGAPRGPPCCGRLLVQQRWWWAAAHWARHNRAS